MKKYITTPIYYPNAKPHIGTAYTTIICDVLARYERLFSNDVSFVTGLDEHGQKIEQSAEKNNVTPKQWVDKMNEDFVSLWDKLKISYTDYIRTTDKNHELTVEDIVKRVYEKGDIYKGEYKGKYCVSEETFVTDSQLVDGKYLGKEVIEVSEPTYFFRLSKYADKLLQYYENNPNFILPKFRKNEVIAFINQGLQDISISRTTFTWGIPLKVEEGHIIYVWFDALNSYLTGAKYFDKEQFEKNWINAEVSHFIGKDILRFHAILWPAMLMSAGIKLPSHICAHGWWTVNGEKMSKSLGNVVDPNEEIEKYGLDAFRYFLIRESTFGLDADYSNELMVSRINSDLANDLGNLLNRTIGMQKKYFGKNVLEATNLEQIEKEIYEMYDETLKSIKEKLETCSFSEVLKDVFKLISRMNKYIDETSPWLLFKEGKTDRLKTVMYTLFDMIYKFAYLLSPVLVDSCSKILNQIGLEYDKNMTFEKLGKYAAGTEIREAEPIFPRIEVKKEEYSKEPIESAISIDEFSKVNISVVQILSVQKVEGSDKLLKFIVDTGKLKRQIISGLAKSYDNLEELVGKKVLAVVNLKEAKILNDISYGMLLTTTKGKLSKLIIIDDEIKTGVKIK